MAIEKQRLKIVRWFDTHVVPADFYKIDPKVRHQKAPIKVLRTATILEIMFIGLSFSVFYWYFTSVTTTETIVSSKLLNGYDCTSLNPLTGVYYNRGLGNVNSSENGQFSGSFLKYDDCVNYLQGSNVCNNTYDFISVVGSNSIGFPDRTNLFTPMAAFASGGFVVWGEYQDKDGSAWASIDNAQWGNSSALTRPNVPILAFPGHSDRGHFYYVNSTGVHSDFDSSTNRAVVAFSEIPWVPLKNNFELILSNPVLDGKETLCWSYTSGYLISYNPQTLQTDYYFTVASELIPLPYVVVDGYWWGFSSEGESLIRINIVTNESVVWKAGFSSTVCSINGDLGSTPMFFFYSYSARLIYGFCHFETGDHIFSIDPSIKFNFTLLPVGTDVVKSGLTSANATAYVANNKMYILWPFVYLEGSSDYIGAYFDLNTGMKYHLLCEYMPFCNVNFKGHLANMVMSPTYTDLIYISIVDSTSSVTSYAFNTSNFQFNEVNFIYATRYMLTYTYGICNGVATKSFVNISASMDYSVQCQTVDGFYYQAPNIWYSVPVGCEFMQPNALLTQCPQVVEQLNQLKADTCQASIPKMCHASYTLNPPFSCSRKVSTPWLTSLASSFANTNVVWGLLSIVIGYVLSKVYEERMEEILKGSLLQQYLLVGEDPDKGEPKDKI